MFASFNSSGRNGAVGALRTALFQRFADRYFPGRRTRDASIRRRPSSMRR